MVNLSKKISFCPHLKASAIHNSKNSVVKELFFQILSAA